MTTCLTTVLATVGAKERLHTFLSPRSVWRLRLLNRKTKRIVDKDYAYRSFVQVFPIESRKTVRKLEFTDTTPVKDVAKDQASSFFGKFVWLHKDGNPLTPVMRHHLPLSGTVESVVHMVDTDMQRVSPEAFCTLGRRVFRDYCEIQEARNEPQKKRKLEIPRFS